MECLSYCIADKIDISRLDAFCKREKNGLVSLRYRDVVKLTLQAHPESTVYVFINGTIVCWNVKRYRTHIYREIIQPFCIKPLTGNVKDDFSYRIADKVSIEPHGYFDVDCLTLESECEDSRLSLSYGFSQSVKLQYFETILEGLIEKFNPMILKLIQGNKKPITRKQVRQVIGEIMGAKSEMNLISNFLYHPKFFWQHPSLELHYIMLERYLHIERRVNALNHRLDTLNEIFEMFNSYLESNHSHFLEIIIIVLIAMEIIFALLNFHF